MINTLNKVAPIKTVQIKNRVPYLTQETKDTQTERENSHKKALNTNNLEDWREYRNL